MVRAVRAVVMVGAVVAPGVALGGRVVAGAPAAASLPSAVETHLVIGYRPGASAAELIPVHARLGARVVRDIVAVHAAVVALPLDTAAAAGPLHTTLFGDEAAAAVTPGIRTAHSTLSLGVAAAAHLYAAQPEVAYVESDVPATIAAPSAPSRRPAAPTGGSALARSDPFAADQWHLDATRLPEAWSQSAADGIRIAIVDTGVQADHPDLGSALQPGWNVRDGSNDTSDDHGHGTAVAGVVAAGVGNGVGVAGAAPGGRIVPVKALGADGTGWMSDVAAGIVWAADHDVKVIVVAAGSRQPLRLLADAVAYAGRRGALVVAAAGNAGAQSLDHPAADIGALAVGAIDVHGALTAWSNRGNGLQLVAPGDDILTTVRDGYATASGTSLSAAIVGGVAALMIAQRPDAGPDEIARRLIATANDNARAPGIVDARAATAGDGEDRSPSARLPGFWQKMPPAYLPAVHR